MPNFWCLFLLIVENIYVLFTMGLCINLFVTFRLVCIAVNFYKNNETRDSNPAAFCLLYIYCSTYDECLRNSQITDKFLQSLGFLINLERSSLTPKVRGTYLGFTVDSVRFGLSVPPEKVKNLFKLINKFLKKTVAKFETFVSY